MSYEMELELKIKHLNSKIILLNRLMTLKLIGRFFIKKYNKVVENRNQLWREWRKVLRKKHPEMLIGGNYGNT